MQGRRQVWQSLHGDSQEIRLPVRSQKDQEGIRQVHGRSVHSVSQDPDVPEPSEAGEDLWLFRRLVIFLHAGLVHGGRVTLFADEEEQKVRRIRDSLETRRDLLGYQVNAQPKHCPSRFETLECCTVKCKYGFIQGVCKVCDFGWAAIC